MIVDGRQMVFLNSVHGRGSLFDLYGLLHFSLVPVGFTLMLILTSCVLPFDGRNVYTELSLIVGLL